MQRVMFTNACYKRFELASLGCFDLWGCIPNEGPLPTTLGAVFAHHQSLFKHPAFECSFCAYSGYVPTRKSGDGRKLTSHTVLYHNGLDFHTRMRSLYVLQQRRVNLYRVPPHQQGP